MSTRGSSRTRRRRTIFAAHLFVAGLVVANCAWIAADELKRLALARARSPVLAWTALFNHPEDAALLPYVAAALAAFAWGLYLYVRLRPPAFRGIRRLWRAACARSPVALVAIAAVQPVLASEGLPRGVRAAMAALSVVACAARRRPATGGGVRARGAALPRAGANRWLAAASAAAIAAILVAIAVEPVRLATGPVRLLNEYPYLAERALGNGDPPGGGDEVALSRCRFAYENSLEYELQSSTRGQMNHIGHVLNPINEYATGKPLDRTYFQYGLGATFLFKWVMDLSGGPSLQGYYRSLLFFVAYWLVFAAAAAVLFRDARYVLAAVGLLAVAHYMLGYEALLFAAGINPVLHFLDLPVLLACIPFFRTGRAAPLALGVLGVVAAVAMNVFFGSLVAAAFCVSTGMYVLESAPPARRWPRMLALAAAVAVPLAALAVALPRTGGAGITARFLLGFLSWRPPAPLVFLTVAYVTGSYLLLLLLRDRRDPAKYAIVYLFVYAQGFLLYFHWSGLENHFWPAFPYVGLHLLLVARVLGRSPRFARWEPWVLAAAMAGIVVAGRIGVSRFAAERAGVRTVFASQQTYRWPFLRARAISTVEPGAIAASLSQIERYSSAGDRGICMLSVFDNMIPFLAGRHSIFTHFDLQWAVLTEDDRRRAVATIAAARPAYLFVGREVEGEVADPWEGVAPCGAPHLRAEQEAARGRLRELRSIFDAISPEYERLEAGPVLSVYRRRGAGS